MRNSKALCAALLITFGTASASQAALVNADLPTNAYISFGGFDWAWASPVTADGSWGAGSQIDLSFQSAFGWRLPTMAELLNAPAAIAFIFQGANVPDGGVDPVSGANFASGSPGGDAACATPYFSNMFVHCDWGDGRGGSFGFDWAGTNGSTIFSDQLVIRSHSNPSPVPVPAAGFMLLAGIGALVAAKRRKSV